MIHRYRHVLYKYPMAVLGEEGDNRGRSPLSSRVRSACKVESVFLAFSVAQCDDHTYAVGFDADLDTGV